MKVLFLITFLFIAVGKATAQLPDIFADTPKQIAKTETIAEFPVNTFLENIAVDKKGNLFVTSLEDGKIYKVSPVGKKTEFAQIKGKIAGLAFDKSENLIVTGWADGTTPSVFIVSKNGKLSSTTAIGGAMFLNGITPLKGDTFLIADSYKGAIWLFDAKAKSYQIWLADKMLLRGNEQNPIPAVNGLKIFKNTVYATNTQEQKILRIPILANGTASKPEVWLEKINGDDFVFDAAGNIFLTTHIYNNVLKIEPSGKATIIAESSDVIGDTALAFGKGKNKNTLFVVTNGGMSLPPKEGVQKAKIVKIEVTK
jgi:hypothetical protein